MSCKPKTPVSMPFAHWPEQDKTLWRAAEQPIAFAIMPVPLAEWCKIQRQTAAKHYGQWLRYLQTTAPDLLAQPPGQRMTPGNLGQFFTRRHAEVSVTSLAKYACDLYGVMRSLTPEQDWGWLKQFRHLITSHAKRRLPKDKAFTHASELLRVGEELIATAFASSDKIQDPFAFRDGLIILMLILVPVRITQFSLIQLDRHLVQKPQGEWLLHWGAEETKTRRAATHPLPKELVEVLQIYIDAVRPILMRRAAAAATTKALWIGVSGQPISSQVLRKIINARTNAVLGYKVNPHAFRASAASSYAIDAPEYAREAPALLDHSNPRTTERYYLLGQRERHLLTAHDVLQKARRRSRQHTRDQR